MRLDVRFEFPCTLQFENGSRAAWNVEPLTLSSQCSRFVHWGNSGEFEDSELTSLILDIRFSLIFTIYNKFLNVQRTRSAAIVEIAAAAISMALKGAAESFAAESTGVGCVLLQASWNFDTALKISSIGVSLELWKIPERSASWRRDFRTNTEMHFAGVDARTSSRKARCSISWYATTSDFNKLFLGKEKSLSTLSPMKTLSIK